MKITKIGLLVVMFLSQAFLNAEHCCNWTNKYGKKIVPCHRPFDSVPGLKKHVETFHINAESRPNQCFWQEDDGEVCEEKCFDIYDLKKHMQDHFPLISLIKVKEESVAVKDDEETETDEDKPLIEKKRVAVKKEKKEPRSDAEQVFTCGWCKDGKSCGKTRKSFESLYQHVLDDHIEKAALKCFWEKQDGDICNKHFSQARRSNFKRHISSHAGYKPHQCTWEDESGICKKSFNLPHQLQAHIRAHKGEKPYGCSCCSSRFADRSNGIRHLKTHPGGGKIIEVNKEDDEDSTVSRSRKLTPKKHKKNYDSDDDSFSGEDCDSSESYESEDSSDEKNLDDAVVEEVLEELLDTVCDNFVAEQVALEKAKKAEQKKTKKQKPVVSHGSTVMKKDTKKPIKEKPLQKQKLAIKNKKQYQSNMVGPEAWTERLLNLDGLPWLCTRWEEKWGEPCGRSFNTMIELEEHRKTHMREMQNKWLASQSVVDVQ